MNRLTMLIEFDKQPRPLPTDYGAEHAWASVTIGDFREQLIIPTAYWKPPDYYRQWRAACAHLLDTRSHAIFLVDVRGEWQLMNMSFAWIAYADEAAVRVQNTMLFPSRCPQADLNNPHSAAPERSVMSDEGERISEWQASLEEIKAFADHLAQGIP